MNKLKDLYAYYSDNLIELGAKFPSFFNYALSLHENIVEASKAYGFITTSSFKLACYQYQHTNKHTN